MADWTSRAGQGWWRGPAGVRAGWRGLAYLLIALVLVAVEIAGLAWLKPPWVRPTALLTPRIILLNEVLLLVPIYLASLAMARAEGREVAAFGLRQPRPVRALAGGLAAGIAVLSLLIGLLWGGGLARISLQGLGLVASLASLAAWLVVSLLVGVTEELGFRGYPLVALARGIGFWPAALLTSLVFALLHVSNGGESVTGILNVFGAGMILCLARQRTGGLWWPIGFHTGWDFAQNVIFGTHDSGQGCAGALLSTLPVGPAWLSGGLTGPEGSVIGLGVELAVALTILRLLPARRDDFDMDQRGPSG
ncbi:CPBP family intramembrane glutamic endopeptidase [Acidocella facilis]|uniref:CPBP family intramembrane glutamic endopeptidase n=1 Tax=Acidocella facilis TaxID=525 RepID=UPI0012DFC819|nr:type II CAAX endopeptidase family protein [Acidocella facilis]